jgi:hypothetical protein
MRNLLRCRRGSVAFATVVAAVPMIGAVALGAEAGSWYVTRQHAQNAADAAAYSGGLWLACSRAGTSGTCSTDPQSMSYRGKEFAAQNAFCNAGDTSYPGSRCTTPATGTSQTVTLDQGNYSGGTFTPGSGNYVRAKVSQTQPAYLAAVLGLSTVNIGAQAIAQVQNPTKPCVLALSGSISFQGSPSINAPNCGVASNSTAANALNFTGGGMTINVGSLSASGGCTGTATFCKNALTYVPAVTNPFAVLDSVTLPTLSACSVDKKNPTLTAYSTATPCKNDNVSLTGNNTVTLNGGVYFISGALTLTGTTAITGNALFILLPGASFSMKGSGTISLNPNGSVTSSQLPTVLQPYTSLLANMAIYDQSSTAITLGGNSNITLLGNMYIPNADVTFQGNPTVSSCGELIAKSVAFNGNASFNNTGCSSATQPTSQYVVLVQ